jgi:hypothetical protein
VALENLDFKNVTGCETSGQSHISESGRDFSPCHHVRIGLGPTEWGLDVPFPRGKEVETGS